MTFNPERWLEGSGDDNNDKNNGANVKEASQPFSLGPRGCLGRK